MKAGDLLFTIDPEPYQAAVSQAEGQVASAEAKVNLAQIELERGQQALSDNWTISQSDLDQRQNAQSRSAAPVSSTAQAALQVGTARTRLYRGPGTGRRPCRQARNHRRQSRRRRFRVRPR